MTKRSRALAKDFAEQARNADAKNAATARLTRYYRNLREAMVTDFTFKMQAQLEEANPTVDDITEVERLVRRVLKRVSDEALLDHLPDAFELEVWKPDIPEMVQCVVCEHPGTEHEPDCPVADL